MSESSQEKPAPVIQVFDTLEEFRSQFNPNTHDSLLNLYMEPGVHGLLLFENRKFDHARFGRRIAMAYGEGCQRKEPPTEIVTIEYRGDCLRYMGYYAKPQIQYPPGETW